MTDTRTETLIVSTFANERITPQQVATGLVNTLPDRVTARMWVQPDTAGKIRALRDGVTSFLGAVQVIWVPEHPGPDWATPEDAVTGLKTHWELHLPTPVGALNFPSRSASVVAFPLPMIGMQYFVDACDYLTMTNSIDQGAFPPITI